jgi:hypothetical protein
MPVGASGRLEVVCETGMKTTGTEGGTDIQIVSRLDSERSELANGDRRYFARYEHNSVGP